MKLGVFVLSTYLLCLSAAGQTKSRPVPVAFNQNSPEINPGEKVPDVHLRPIGQAPFQLSSLKGKLVIIDFFGIHCSSCISHLPEMQSFQEQFPDQIKILVVTKDDSVSVKKLLSRIPRLKNITLPFITSDSVLSEYFYYTSLPTHVWIDRSGTVIQKTAGYNTSFENIQSWLAGKKINLPAKKELRDYQKGVPLFVEGGGRQVNKLQYYSVIMGRPDGLDGQSDIRIDKDPATGKPVRILIAGSSLLYLYRYAFMEGNLSKDFVFQRGRVLLDVKHPEIFELPDDASLLGAWKEQYTCSYEIRVPPERSDRIYKWMKSDLERYYGYTAKVEDRKVECWVLKAAGNFKISVSKGPANWELGDNYFRATNLTLREFLDRLRYSKRLLKATVISDLNEKTKIDLDLNCAVDDTDKLNTELRKYGLLLVKEKRILPMLVISEK
jgi:thiol-disulfide isomerase/thioredoxin